MVASCSAYGCSERFVKGSSIRLFRFPSNEVKKSLWCLAIKRKDWMPTRHSRICSKHFQNGWPSEDKMNPDYVPNVFVFNKNETSATLCMEQKTRLEKKALPREKEKRKVKEDRKTSLSLKTCAVVGCRNTDKNSEVHFFGLPHSEERLKQWKNHLPIDSCQSTVICSDHFNEHDYASTSRGVLLAENSVPRILNPQAGSFLNSEIPQISCHEIKQEVDDDFVTEVPATLRDYDELSSTTSTASESVEMRGLEDELSDLKKSLADRVKECKVLQLTLSAFEMEKAQMSMKIGQIESQLRNNYERKSTEDQLSGLPKKLKMSFKAHAGSINSLLWFMQSPITAGSDGKIKIWVLNQPSRVSSEFDLAPETVFSIDLSGNDDFICASYDNIIQVWDSCRVPRCILTEHKKVVPVAKFIKPLDHLVSGCLDGSVKIWDLVKGCSSITYDSISGVNDVVGISEHCVASGHNDGKIRFWDLRIKRRISRIVLETGISSLDLSSNKSVLLTSEVNGTVRTFDSQEFTELQVMEAENRKISNQWTRARFNPDNQLCCRGSANGIINVWNVESGALQQTLKWGNSSVKSCAWSSCGTHFASSMADQCNIWTTDLPQKWF